MLDPLSWNRLSCSRDNSVEGEVEVHKQDPGVDGIVYRSVGSAGKLQGVQEWVYDGFEIKGTR